MNTATGTPEKTATDTSSAIDVRGVDKSFGTTAVLRDVSLRVAPGSIVALLGPSGCGKTTLLRSIAGLERIDAGEIRIGDRVVSAPSAYVLPEKRRVGMVFQDWALFPHLTVAQNVAYGLPRTERKGHRVAEVLELVDLPALGDRLPSTLSGGQQQRVALARALAPQPRVLLLDEPFSNLDTALRVQVRSEVHQLLAELGVTTIFVTHDQEEAFVLGDEVAVLHDGRLVQQAPPAELYARPASPWVAGFVGDANLVPGTADGVCARTPVGLVPLEEPAGGAVQVLLRPEELRLDAANGNGDQPAVVELREYYGHDTVYLVRPEGSATVRVRAGSVPRFGRGDRVAIRYVGPPAVAFSATNSAQ
jgi:iron(III) transport system ATP-binding protein